jgi:deoxyadenosine/deoxycytidine kinase
MTKYVNIFGGPGVGKSTAAASLFVEMKKLGLKVELVTEVAKDFVWEDRLTTLSIQPYITIKQFRNLVRLKGKVDYVITDAPILLGCVYADKYAPTLPSSYKNFIVDLHRYELDPSINIVLQRSFKYDSTGRYQNEDQAKELDRDILKVLNDNKVRWDLGHSNQIDLILDKIRL